MPAKSTIAREIALSKLLAEWCETNEYTVEDDAAVHLHELLNQAFNAGAMACADGVVTAYECGFCGRSAPELNHQGWCQSCVDPNTSEGWKPLWR